MAKGQGNQHLNWVESEDGAILKRNPLTENFEYAQIKNERLAPSGEKFQKRKGRNAKSLKETKRVSKESVYKLWAKKREDARKRRNAKSYD